MSAITKSGEKLDQATLHTFIKSIRDDRIIVRPETPLKAISQMLAMPDGVREDQFEESPFRVGRVLMCGPGMGVQGDPDKLYPMDVKPGDRILHHKAARDRIFLNGEILLVIGNRDVSMVIGDYAEFVQVIHKKGA